MMLQKSSRPRLTGK